jgi:excisionase family DNA binding protein
VDGGLGRAFLGSVEPADLEALTPEALRCLARLLEPHLSPDRSADSWMTTQEAAKHLGLTPNAVYKLIRERRIPFHQERPNAKCWFRKSELNAWRVTGSNGSSLSLASGG